MQRCRAIDAKFKSEICFKIGQCIAEILSFIENFSGNVYSRGLG